MRILLNQYFNTKITTFKIMILDRKGFQATIFLEDYTIIKQ